jgi:hypothetical protein
VKLRLSCLSDKTLLQKNVNELKMDICEGKPVPVLNYAPHHNDVCGSSGIIPHILIRGTR